jgi:acyl carrier protein
VIRAPRPVGVADGRGAPGVGIGQREETALANEAVFERVRTIVAERLGVEEEKVTLDAEFINDLNADSLDLVGVISDLEDAFSLTIADSDMENIRTVGDAVELIAERIS